MQDLETIGAQLLPAGAAYATLTATAGGSALRGEAAGGEAWAVRDGGPRVPWDEAARELARAGVGRATVIGAALRMEPGARVPWETLRAMAPELGALSVGDGRFRGSLGRVTATTRRVLVEVTLRHPLPRVDEAPPAERATYELGAWLDFYRALAGREPEARTLDCGPWLRAGASGPPSRPPALPWRGEEAGRAARADPLLRVALPAAPEARGPEGMEALTADELAARVSLDFGAGSLLALEEEGGRRLPGLFEATPGGGLLHHVDHAPLTRARPYALARLGAPGVPWGAWASRRPGGAPRVFYAHRIAQVLPQDGGPGWEGPPDLLARPGRSLLLDGVARHFSGWPRVFLWFDDGRVAAANAAGDALVLDPGAAAGRVLAASASPSVVPGAGLPRRHVAAPDAGGWRVLDRAAGERGPEVFATPEAAWEEADRRNRAARGRPAGGSR